MLNQTEYIKGVHCGDSDCYACGTQRYNCDKLVYFEEYENGLIAEKREKQFKKWKRNWKIELIEEMNPNWTDLSLNWNLNFNKIRE